MRIGQQIDQPRFLKNLSDILQQQDDLFNAQDLIDMYEGYKRGIEHLQLKLKKPINERTGKPIKETTLRQYRSQLSNDLKRKKEIKLLIVVCQELGLLESPRMTRKGGGPQRLRRSRAKLQVLPGGIKASRPF